MRILGLEITRAKALTAIDTRGGGGGGFFGLIHESFTGAWQAGVTVDSRKDITAFSAVYAAVTIVASDIGKLRLMHVKENATTGVWTEVRTKGTIQTLLRKPNRHQTRQKFVESWIVSKLLHGNAYAMKQRDAQGNVIALYILDPLRTQPLIADNGDVYYELSSDNIAGLTDSVTVPASEIIHDPMVCLWHPLVGVSPIYACGMSATMGNRILKNSTRLFQNMSRPSGVLTSPGNIVQEKADEIKKRWEQNFSGDNIGRIAILGSGLEWQEMTVSANDAQLIEQLKWAIEDVARCYHVPVYKIGVAQTGTDVEALNQIYYSDCLQALIESMEASLDDGLKIEPGQRIQFDLDGLLRMDASATVAAEEKWVKAGIKSPNEARERANLPPVEGGETPYLQQQNFPLSDLKKRSEKADPFAAGGTTEGGRRQGDAPKEGDDSDDDMGAAARLFNEGLTYDPA